MDFETADNLSKNISEEGPKLGFNEPIYAQYVKYYGYKEPSFSASDMVYALQTLLWIKRSKINEFNIGEIDFFDVFKDTNNPWWDNFHTVLDTIECLDEEKGLKRIKGGIELRKNLQPHIISSEIKEFIINV
ncbi:880_t:CDS:2 [Entrophospora sp. SA101]|nr:880_t:CDS:2 [Entrophospora sp. SA101]